MIKKPFEDNETSETHILLEATPPNVPDVI